ncbi:MAG TPA: class I SAM-dependent methyltransferase, partial [Candidatus Limnocylindria bacterium]|nr:class I SAM-dependent methyltransferase [Candidatus Limnocylindria bacterium]
MRELACPICDGTARRRLCGERAGPEPRDAATRVADPEGQHYRINRCLGCGLVYSSPIFDEAGVAALYTHSPHTNSPHTNVRPGEEDNVRQTFRGYYRLARPHLAARKRILDIGCDMGLLLGMAAGDGFEELHGVEPNPMAAAVARAVPRTRIMETFYESTEYPEDHFDLVTLIHVVDHLVEPIRLLTRVRRDLTPGGVVLAVVHNAGSLLARVLGERFRLVSDGESTISPVFVHAVVHGSEVGLSMACGTNGFIFNRRKLEEVLPHLTYLRINISAGERKRYSEIMGVKEEWFDRVVQNIRDMVDIKQRENL